MPIGLVALALAAFAVGTGEFIISGLLPDLAADFRVSIPVTGLLVSVYAAAVAIGGPVLALLTAHLPRKALILSLLGIFCLAQAFCALAPSFGWLMAGRVFAAASHGLFFGAGSVAAIGLVGPERRGMAMALFLGGITVANLFGIPAGTAIGNAFGWRWSFWVVGACGLAAALMVALLLPSQPAEERHAHSLRAEFGALANHRVYLSYLVILLAMIGTLSFATYQVPAMIEVTGIPIERAPIYLIISGCGAIFGIYAGGRAADWRLMPSLIAVLVAQVVIAAILLYAIRQPATLAAGLFCASLVNWSLNAPVQSRILTAAKGAPYLASTLISTAYNVGIAAGAWFGGLWIAGGLGYATLPAIGVVSSLLAAGVAAMSWRLDGKR